MAQSLSNVLLHLVFSTKHRRPWINVDLDEELAEYVAGITKDNVGPLCEVIAEVVK